VKYTSVGRFNGTVDGFDWREWREQQNTSILIASTHAETRNENFPKTSQKCYRFSKLARSVFVTVITCGRKRMICQKMFEMN
jgi:hypothetical protein